MRRQKSGARETLQGQVGVGRASNDPATEQVVAVLAAADLEPATRGDLRAAAGLRHSECFRIAVLDRIVAAGWLKRTIADKPKSPNQRYRLTADGSDVLQQRGKE